MRDFLVEKITPKANKCTTIEVPPWLIKGKGTPTTGIIPITIRTLIKINKRKIKPSEQHASLSNEVSAA
tara:strand:+ start:717 stop:923 length:207 start_codon:yes stop_codon:yes gene_type:complete